MIPSILLFAAAGPVNATPPVLEPALTAGLSVIVDGIPEPVAVDGVSMAVQRVTGAGVPELARRVETQWRRQGGQIDAQQQGTWTVRSRIVDARTQVLQWRSDPQGAELLLSSIDVRAPVLPVPPPGLVLPAGCTWGRSISGRSATRSYLQRSARCVHSVQSLSVQLRQSLPTQGWHVRAASDSGLLVERAQAEGFISISTQEGDQATWITWLRTEASP